MLFLWVTLLLGDTSTEVLFRAPIRISTLVLDVNGTCSPPSNGRSCTQRKLIPSERERKENLSLGTEFFD